MLVPPLAAVGVDIREQRGLVLEVRWPCVWVRKELSLENGLNRANFLTGHSCVHVVGLFDSRLGQILSLTVEGDCGQQFAV